MTTHGTVHYSLKCAVAPEFDKAPELTVTVTPGTNNVTLQCKFQMFFLEDLRYTAVWYINSSPIKNVDLPDNVSVSTLTQEEIKGVAYGDTVSIYIVWNSPFFH